MPYGKKKDSAAKMGHEKSPAELGHKDSPAKMESAKQERKNLLQDNPVAKHASGSWLSKHAGHSRMSPAKMDHSPLNDNHDKMIVYPDRKNQKGESQVDIMNKRTSDANTAIDAYNKGTGTRNAAEDASKKYEFSKDSINTVNVKIDKLLGGLDKKRKDILSGKH